MACGFDVIGFKRIEGITDPDNHRSMHLLKRKGFTHEGTTRESYHFDGKVFDSAIWSMLAREWEESK